MSTPGDSHPTRRGRLCVVGTGPGPGYLTPRGFELMRSCDHFVGGAAALVAAPAWGDHLPVAGPLDPLLDEVAARLETGEAVCVLTSGDPGYFSLLAALERRFPGEAVVEPGLSSAQLLAARLRMPWQEVRHFSVHGRELDLDPPADAPFVVLCSPENGPREVAAYLAERGLAGIAAVGVSLGRAEESISVAPLHDLAGRRGDDLPSGPALLLVWPDGAGEAPFARDTVEGPSNASPTAAPGAEYQAPTSPTDEEFIRGDGVPLSRFDSRLMLAGIARPETRCLIWDVGAGSGGFTVELGLRSPLAKIVAFERSEAACTVLRQNVERFGVRAEVVEQAAPQGLERRDPAERPDLVVVGGSGGRLGDVLGLLAERMAPGGRVICAAVTLETVAAATNSLCVRPWLRFDALQVTSARRGRHGILQGNNPVTFLWADRGED